MLLAFKRRLAGYSSVICSVAHNHLANHGQVVGQYNVGIEICDGFRKLPILRVLLINKNEISDIEVSVEFKRTGRKVDGLYFKAKERKQTCLPFPEFEPHKAFAFAKVAISIQDQHKYLEAMPPEEIEATIQRANEYGDSIKAKGQQVQMGGIYHKAFLERWGVQYLAQHQAEQVATKQAIDTKKQQDQLEQAKKTIAEKAAQGIVN